MESKTTKNLNSAIKNADEQLKMYRWSSSEDNSKHKMSHLFETAAQNIAGIYKHYKAQESTQCLETAIIVLWPPWRISVLEQKKEK